MDFNKNLTEFNIGESGTIVGINDVPEEMERFLFSLGCFAGENITLISKVSNSYIVNVKNARYSLDCDLAEAILF